MTERICGVICMCQPRGAADKLKQGGSIMTEHRTDYDLDEPAEIMGVAIYIDRSGVGHSWHRATKFEAVCVEDEIAGEMVEGGRVRCSQYRASNGCYYRW